MIVIRESIAYYFLKVIKISVLELNLTYIVKYSTLSSGVPSIFALRYFLRKRPLFDLIFLVSS